MIFASKLFLARTPLPLCTAVIPNVHKKVADISNIRATSTAGKPSDDSQASVTLAERVVNSAPKWVQPYFRASRFHVASSKFSGSIIRNVPHLKILLSRTFFHFADVSRPVDSSPRQSSMFQFLFFNFLLFFTFRICRYRGCLVVDSWTGRCVNHFLLSSSCASVLWGIMLPSHVRGLPQSMQFAWFAVFS